MGFFTVPLTASRLPEDVLERDKKECKRFGPCGVGREAIYLNGRFLDRRFYAVWSDIKRVHKRVALSKGGFTGKGIFGALPFLFVEFKDGRAREFPFKVEADVDNMLAAIEAEHPEIPTYSEAAKAKLEQAEAEERALYVDNLSDEALSSIEQLESDMEFLNERVSLSEALTSAAQQKRVTDNYPIQYKVIGSILGYGGLLVTVYGLYALIFHKPHPFYFIAFGVAAFFFALASNTMPNKWNNKRVSDEEWAKTLEQMRVHLREKPDFALPAQYAHPTVMLRTIRVIKHGRAESIEDAFAIMKEDLRALNSSVTVSQKEHDEVVKIKPLFLVCDYKDEL